MWWEWGAYTPHFGVPVLLSYHDRWTDNTEWEEPALGMEEHGKEQPGDACETPRQ